MRYYVLINNQSSLEISGLYISKLPPISKPLKRTNIEEIDGRDGDIVTTLGYGSVDKEMEIGLFGDYDINEIISFFNQEGIITFSNEADKYYKFTILNNIDFEEFQRFKTATVTFHCQPFKLSATEGERKFTQFTNDSIMITNNGNIYSKPILTITGSGTINLSLNGTQVAVIALDNNGETIEIDLEKLEAYNPSTNLLMNRQVTGNYENLYLKIGNNTISWVGTVSLVKIKNYSRWI